MIAKQTNKNIDFFNSSRLSFQYKAVSNLKLKNVEGIFA